jgi:hypothetical protein
MFVNWGVESHGALEDSPMSAAVLNALKIVQALSPDEQRDLIHSVEVQLHDHDDLGLDPEFIAEINRRSDEIDAGLATGRPWPDIRKELLAELDHAP